MIQLTAHGSRKSAVVQAGKVGNIVLANDGNDPAALQPGDRVRLVCPRPGCSPGVSVGKARLNAHPPILSVVVPARDVRPGSSQVGRGSGGSPNVGFYFAQQGSNLWCSFTAAHVNRYSAAVVDGVVAEAFVFGEALCDGTFVIVQPLNTERAFEVVGYLNTGPLPVGLRLQS
jgi:preprotein translocase subunit SecD